jgi:hypothetical protein
VSRHHRRRRTRPDNTQASADLREGGRALVGGVTVDPGSQHGDFTTIKVTYYDVAGPDGRVAPFETFMLRRPRHD